MPLRGGERGCCLGQFPDPGIQAAAGVGCGVPVVVVTLVAFGRGVAAGPACRRGSGFPLRCCSPGTHELKASHWRSAGKSWCGNIDPCKPDWATLRRTQQYWLSPANTEKDSKIFRLAT